MRLHKQRNMTNMLDHIHRAGRFRHGTQEIGSNPASAGFLHSGEA